MVQLNEDYLISLERNNNASDLNSTELDYNSQSITDITPHLFDNYKSVTTLQLHVNNLTEIPRGLFRHLSELQDVAISKNQIKTIDSDIFAGNPKLKTIYLNDNELESLPPGVFDNLPELEELYLKINKLTSFDFNSLKGSPKLKELYLYENNLFEILNFDQHKILWKNLTKIDLKNNKIPCLQELRDISDPNIVELDEDTEETRNVYKHGRKVAGTKGIAERDALETEKKQLILELEDMNLKLMELKQDIALEEEKAKKETVARNALEEEKKLMILEMEVEKTKCDEVKKNLLAECEKTKIVTNDSDIAMDILIVLNNFQDLVIKGLNTKLDNLAIRVVVQPNMKCDIPNNDNN